MKAEDEDAILFSELRELRELYKHELMLMEKQSQELSNILTISYSKYRI